MEPTIEEEAAVERFVQVIVDGLATGSLYGALALAVVLIYRSTGIVNFAQGELAMFSTFVAWALMQAGLPLGGALLGALVLSFAGGMLIERLVIRPVEGGEVLTLVIVTLGLYILVNSLAGWIWGFGNRAFPSLFGDGSFELAGSRVAVESVGIVVVLIAVVLLLYLVFQRTKVGLAMRAVSFNPESSRLHGISVGRTLMVGWGVAALVGALAGALIAPRLFLDVNFMGAVLIYSFAAATLGGFDSPFGAVLGGWIVGIAEGLAGTYVDFIGSDLKILVPLTVILVVLLIRPTGLFGSAEVARA
jgi:branched-chain amino acid transport system permease protein